MADCEELCNCEEAEEPVAEVRLILIADEIDVVDITLKPVLVCADKDERERRFQKRLCCLTQKMLRWLSRGWKQCFAHIGTRNGTLSPVGDRSVLDILQLRSLVSHH